MEAQIGEQLILDPQEQHKIITGLMFADLVAFQDFDLESFFDAKTEEVVQ